MKTTLKNIGKYVRELSIVVLGVTVTFIGSDLLKSRGEQADLQMCLNAVKIELEDNVKLMKGRSQYFDRSRQFQQYLHSEQVDQLNIDSLRSYRDITHNYSFLTYNSSAFEMLKTSGLMRLIKDKRMLQNIWDSYLMLEQTKLESNHYMQDKANLIMKLMNQKANPRAELDIRDPKNIHLIIFYTNGVAISLKEMFDESIDKIQTTLNQF